MGGFTSGASLQAVGRFTMMPQGSGKAFRHPTLMKRSGRHGRRTLLHLGETLP